MQEVDNIINILEQAIIAVKQGDSGKIKDLSNQTIHSSSIYQDPDNINVAVIVYALSKLIERKNIQNFTGWQKFIKFYINTLENALIALRERDIEAHRDQINGIKEKIEGLSGNLKRYLEEVLRKAEINKASKMYEHGISMQKTASILGLTIWELNSYIGQSSSGSSDLIYTKDIKQRIKEVNQIFNQ